jgi:hypothetical protein
MGEIEILDRRCVLIRYSIVINETWTGRAGNGSDVWADEWSCLVKG